MDEPRTSRTCGPHPNFRERISLDKCQFEKPREVSQKAKEGGPAVFRASKGPGGDAVGSLQNQTDVEKCELAFSCLLSHMLILFLQGHCLIFSLQGISQ